MPNKKKRKKKKIMEESEESNAASVPSNQEAPESSHDEDIAEKASASGNVSEQGDSEPTSVTGRRGKRAKSGSIAKRIACK